MKLYQNLFLGAMLGHFFCFAQQPQIVEDSINSIELPEIQLIGQRDGILKNVPGSVATINKIQLQKVAPLTANEMLRQVSGVQVVDEEGAGLRVNIGIRGLDPDRSRSVLILEDGVPVALNPYGEPEMYYSPVIDRMSGIEIVKGSGQILFGPQTIGGVINYKTANPPEKESFRVKLTGGEKGFFSGLASYGTTVGNVGLQVNYLRKQADNLGYASFRINDLSAKMRIVLNEKSTLGVKFGTYTETSNATYIGLTQSMYDAGNQDFTLMAPDDKLNIRRNSASVSHQYQWNSRLKLQTTVFGYTTTRDWRRQDFSSTPTTNMTGVVWGDTSIANGTVYMRNTTGNRNRQFEVLGVEPRLTYGYSLGNVKSELQTGLRYLYERAYEQRINGKKYNASAGDMVENEIRTGKAMSAYAQNQLTVWKNFTFTGGLRLESYDYSRNILRNTFTINGVKSVRDTNIVANSQIFSLIPGMGLTYNYLENHTFFAGVHKGFAPPRVKDAITASGEAYNLAAENSWNFEAGMRGKFEKQGISYDFAAFYMDFKNQIIPVSESSGGTGAGLVNGGKTLHAGFEFGAKWDIAKLFSPNYTLAISTNATYTHAVFNADRFVKNNIETVNVKGNRTPYAPQYLVSSGINAELPMGLGLQMNALFVGKQFSDALNTINPTADGRDGLLKAYQVYDANLYYKNEKWHTTFNLGVKNLTNERYIVSRRPQGIRVGIPRFITAGIDVQL
ncbi:MAG: TonB-dependent receptor family protein [Bacteroidia bacterium]